MHIVKYVNITVVKLFKMTNKFITISISIQPAIHMTLDASDLTQSNRQHTVIKVIRQYSATQTISKI
jgi:hypothetical protein